LLTLFSNKYEIKRKYSDIREDIDSDEFWVLAFFKDSVVNLYLESIKGLLDSMLCEESPFLITFRNTPTKP
jgi:hypothetical protein